MVYRPILAALLVAAPLFSAASGSVSAIDAAGNVWLTGTASSVPATATAFQAGATSLPCGSYRLSPFDGPTIITCTHAFLIKQDAAGNVLYATYLAGSSQEAGTALTTDAQGNVYVTGYTYSADFPVTKGAAQSKNAGPPGPSLATDLGAPFGLAYVLPGGDAFVAKFSSGGALLFSTFLGGSGQDIPSLIGVDASGAVYVAGNTTSSDFPLTANAMSSQKASCFFARLSPDGAALTYSTYSGPSILAFDVAGQGRAYLTGGGPYVTIVDTNAGSVVNTTGISTLNAKIAGSGMAIAVDAAQDVFVGISPAPPAYSFQQPAQPVRSPGVSYLVELSADLSRIVAETDLEQTLFDSMQLDSAGNIYAFGHGSGAIPAVPIQPLSLPCSGNGGSFVLESNAAGKLVAASYFRQADDAAVAVPTPGHLLMYRASNAATIPSVILSLNISAQPTANFGCPENLASGSIFGLGPGEIFLLSGTGLGPSQGVSAAPDSTGKYPTTLGGVQVLIDSTPMPLLYVGANEIHAIATFSLPNFPTIEVRYGNRSIPLLDAVPTRFNPGIFSVNGQGAIINRDGTVNSPSNPAPLGSIVSVYGTGTGYLEYPVTDGMAAPIPPPFLTTQTTPEVSFGGVAGITMWSGAAPTLVFGVTQINVQIPPSLPAGTDLKAAPVVLNIEGVSSAPVNISLK